MFRAVYLVLCAVLVTVTVEEATNSRSFAVRYDNVDIDEIVNNERLVTYYIKCILDKVKCTPEGMEIKRFIPEALETACSKCTDKQKEFAVKMYRRVNNSAFAELAKKFDPTGKYKTKYCKIAKKLVPEIGRC